MDLPIVDAAATQAPPLTFVGLDLSLTATGIAIIRPGGFISVHTVKSKGSADATYEDRVSRLWLLASDILTYIPPNPGTRVAMEGPSFGSKGSGAHIIAGFWWRVLDLLHAEGTDTVVVSPAQVKQYAAGKGNAGKDEVLAAVVRRYPSVEVTNNNEADALTLAAFLARTHGAPVEATVPPLANLNALKKGALR